jgi:hypothetical protein
MVRLPRFLGAFRIHDEQKTTAAADAIGVVECDRLRQRVHGRPVPIEEVLQRLRPFFVRHIVVHSRQRIVDRLPIRRVAVRTVPVAPWLPPQPAAASTADFRDPEGSVASAFSSPGMRAKR